MVGVRTAVSLPTPPQGSAWAKYEATVTSAAEEAVWTNERLQGQGSAAMHVQPGPAPGPGIVTRRAAAPKYTRTGSCPCRPAVDICPRKLTQKWHKPAAVPRKESHARHTCWASRTCAHRRPPPPPRPVTTPGDKGSDTRVPSQARGSQPSAPPASSEHTCRRGSEPQTTPIAKCSSISTRTLLVGIQKHTLDLASLCLFSHLPNGNEISTPLMGPHGDWDKAWESPPQPLPQSRVQVNRLSLPLL